MQKDNSCQKTHHRQNPKTRKIPGTTGPSYARVLRLGPGCDWDPGRPAQSTTVPGTCCSESPCRLSQGPEKHASIKKSVPETVSDLLPTVPGSRAASHDRFFRWVAASLFDDPKSEKNSFMCHSFMCLFDAVLSKRARAFCPVQLGSFFKRVIRRPRRGVPGLRI